MNATPPTKKKPETDNVKVCVRIRPLNRRELKHEHTIAWDWTDRSIQLKGRDLPSLASASSPAKRRNDPPRAAFTFDTLFHPHCDNDEVYDTIGRHVVEGAVRGFHSSIFAYGQTSTGKTHTMLGSGSHISGILGHAVNDVFNLIKSNNRREYLLRVSFMEIYNEALNDLLVPTSKNLVIFEHSKKGCVVRGLLEEVVTTQERILELVSSGLRHRKVGSTNYNAKSSRSHTIFRMVIESKPKGQAPKKRGAVRISTLSMIDLAGSESLKLSGAKGARKAEGGYINKSLLTLGKIIYKLSDSATKNNPNMHVPYRDSKLTRILQSSLKGNSKISIVCCVTPASGCVDETVNTLKFAARAKRIKHKAIINEVEDSHALLHRYRKEIEELKKQLQMYQQSTPAPGLSPTRSNAELLVEEKDKAQLQRIIKQLNDMILDSEKLSTSTPPTPSEDVPTSKEHNGAAKSRPRRGSETTLGGGLLGEDHVLAPSTPTASSSNSKERNVAGALTANKRRDSLAASKHEMRDIKAALELLMERTALANGPQDPSPARTHPSKHMPLPPPSEERVSELEAEVKQLKAELKDKEGVVKESLGLLETSMQNLENLSKQHEEVMVENDQLRQVQKELENIASAADVALATAMDENEELKRELRRFKKICQSREKELLELKGVSAEAESF